MGLLRRGAATTVAAILLCGAAVPGAQEAGAEESDGPTRVMLVGDSITAGYTGDWTWRYRLGMHLTAGSADVDFVGPHHGVSPYYGGPDEYVVPAFDRDHGAVEGRRWASLFGESEVGPQAVVAFDPDVVVVMLGVNDLVFGGADADGIADMATRYIRGLQEVLPDSDIVLAEMTPIAWADVRGANSALAELPARLSTASSRVVLARTSSEYVVEDDTVDYVHPTATGEVKIAAAVADALAQLGVGQPAVRPLPDVPRGPRLSPELSADWLVDGGSEGVQLDWVPHGADGQYVWVRSGANPSWRRLPDLYGGTSAVVTLDPAETHDVALQPVRGLAVAEDDVRSNVVSVPALRPPAASSPTPSTPVTSPPAPVDSADAPVVDEPVPATSPPNAVRRVRTRVRGSGRVLVRWERASGAVRYRLLARRAGTGRWLRFPPGTRRQRVLGPLMPGRYAVRVVAISPSGRTAGSIVRFRVPRR